MMRRELLTLLIEQSRRRRDEAAGVAAQAHKLSRQSEALLGTLEGYRRDYDQKAPKARRTPFDPALLGRHERFVERLDSALDEQRDQTGRLVAQASDRRDDLVKTEQRLRAYELLQQKQEAARRRRADKRDQQATDELATQLSLRRRPTKVQA